MYFIVDAHRRFWSRDVGWVEFEIADRFPNGNIELPHGGRWLFVPDAAVKELDQTNEQLTRQLLEGEIEEDTANRLWAEAQENTLRKELRID